jgi:hypothetical protein
VFDHVDFFEVGYNEFRWEDRAAGKQNKLYRSRPVALEIKKAFDSRGELFPIDDFHQGCGRRFAMKRIEYLL